MCMSLTEIDVSLCGLRKYCLYSNTTQVNKLIYKFDLPKLDSMESYFLDMLVQTVSCSCSGFETALFGMLQFHKS